MTVPRVFSAAFDLGNESNVCWRSGDGEWVECSLLENELIGFFSLKDAAKGGKPLEIASPKTGRAVKFSFGKDVFSSDPEFVNFVFNDRNGNSMYYLDDLMIEYSGNELYGIFEYKKDFLLKNNLLSKKDQFPQLPFMQRQIEAIIQQYVTRMQDNRLVSTEQ